MFRLLGTDFLRSGFKVRRKCVSFSSVTNRKGDGTRRVESAKRERSDIERPASHQRGRKHDSLTKNINHNQAMHLAQGQVLEPFRGRNILASFWRGGTSKGIFIPTVRLPNSLYPPALLHQDQHFKLRWEEHPDRLQPFFATIMGSPDSYGRQLNGLGGGISSLSKAIIYQRPVDDPDADIQYTFIQIGVDDGKLDMTGNCGNLTSVIGPLALNEKLFRPSDDRFDHSRAVQLVLGASGLPKVSVPVTLKLRNTNTGKLIHTTFMSTLAPHSISRSWFYQPAGRYVIDGVPGNGSKISLKFIDPGGSKTGKVLPTGSATDVLETQHDSVRASLVDITNPGIFVSGADLGWDPSRTPAELNANTGLMGRLEAIRRKGTELMGLDPEKFKATPKIVLVYPSDADTVHIRCQALSMEKAHKAVPGTLALNLGAACKLPGTIPYELARQDEKREVVIGHPSGNAEVGAEVDSKHHVKHVELGRTARCLMEGFVNYSDQMRDFEEIAVKDNSHLSLQSLKPASEL